MALDLRTSCWRDSRRKTPGSGHAEPERARAPGFPKRGGSSGLPSSALGVFPYSNSSYVRQELQRLQKAFHRWLRPEQHSKDEMIAQLAREQFLMDERRRDSSVWREEWDSGGRSLEKFMEDLADDCMEPPGYVHVYMQGQEALFSENMPLRDVVGLLTKQLTTGNPTGKNMRSPIKTPQDPSTATERGGEDREDSSNLSLKTLHEHDGITSQCNQVPSLRIIQEETCAKPEEDNRESSRRLSLGTSRPQERALGGASRQDVPMEVEKTPTKLTAVEVQPGLSSRPDPATSEAAPTHQSNGGKSPGGGHQERFHKTPKPYRCEDCPRIFRYLSQLEAHQRRHRNERPFICTECHKGFFQTSDLRVHQVIHKRERPFPCSTCDKSFSHRTNLRAHERIHTGEKPYLCSLCGRSYRQSSTYHRHVRTHKKDR